MQIKSTDKELNEMPRSYVRLVINEKRVERFVEKNGVEELHIVSGPSKKVTPRTFRILLRAIVQAAKKCKIKKLAIELSEAHFEQLDEYGEKWTLSTIAENFLLAHYEHTAYKSKKSKYALEEIMICGGMNKIAQAGLDRGMIVGTYTNRCRDIANTPGGDMTPALLAKEAQSAVKGTKATVKVLDEKAIKKEKMGALLAVGGGAKDAPRFIIMEYWGAGKPNGKKKGLKYDPIVFAGKGITFDTGGLQVKPGMAMYEMHMDMSGGAAVIAAVAAAAKLGVKQNIIGLIPAAENAVGERAMRPGDIITTMSGKTVEVLHTDAEGRLVLADALYYAKRYNPKLVIDIATLTGTALVALGQHASAIMTKDRTFEDTLRDLGEESGDYVHPLPLWDEYKQYTKGVNADISNIPHGDSKYGGTIHGAAFLAHFTEDYSKTTTWAHIDMAPRMTSIASDKLAKGATGEPTKLLLKLAENV